MQPTSHFLGLAIEPFLLDDLFDELGAYIREYQLEDIVEFGLIENSVWLEGSFLAV